MSPPPVLAAQAEAQRVEPDEADSNEELMARYVAGDVAAFAGAGGKSGAILAVADELTRVGMKVLVAPTTKMLSSEADMIGPLVTSEDADDLRA